jgi:hypothetical protein
MSALQARTSWSAWIRPTLTPLAARDLLGGSNPPLAVPVEQLLKGSPGPSTSRISGKVLEVSGT